VIGALHVPSHPFVSRLLPGFIPADQSGNS